MTIEERMLSTHFHSLSHYYKDGLKKMKFKPYFRDPKAKETIVSISTSKKEIYYTRHDLTGMITHAVILQNEHVSRYYVDS